VKNTPKFDFYLPGGSEQRIRGTDLAQIRMYTGMLLYDFAQVVGVKWVKIRELERSSDELDPERYGQLARNILSRITLPPEAAERFRASLARLGGLSKHADLQLQSARKGLRLTQKQLAKALKCSQAFLSRCEHGKRTLSPRHRAALEQLLKDTHAPRSLLGSDQ